MNFLGLIEPYIFIHILENEIRFMIYDHHVAQGIKKNSVVTTFFWSLIYSSDYQGKIKSN